MEDIAGEGPMDGAGVGGIAWIVQVRTNASCIVIFRGLSSRQGVISLRRDAQPNNFQIHLGVLHSQAWKYLSNKSSAGGHHPTIPIAVSIVLYKISTSGKSTVGSYTS
jgi:hypothetical protein